VTRTNAQSDLFGTQRLPEGFRYQPDLVDFSDERSLLGEVEALPFREFQFHGFVIMPDFLLPIRQRAAAFAQIRADDFGLTQPAAVEVVAPAEPGNWNLAAILAWPNPVARVWSVILTLAQLRRRHVIEARPLDAATERALRTDPRSGARAVLDAVERRRYEARSEGQRLRRMMRFETVLWERGLDRVAGVDEAGMSPLAGPVAAGAVVLRPGTRIIGIDDSKRLDAKTRQELAQEIKSKAVAWSVAFVDVEEIDKINIYWAGVLAMRRSVEGLNCAAQHLLIDGRRIKALDIEQQAIVGGDGKSASIAAASILAKTARDELMLRLDKEHPGYDFASHKGYPVDAHRTALRRLGACPIHRRSFGPVREIMGLPPLPPWPDRAHA
jgi:ribonuclease HII